MSLLITWSEPQLCHYEFDLSQPWFVYFTIRNELTGQEVRKQYRGGINHCKTKDDRLREGNALLQYWRSQLEKGLLNPWADPAQRVILDIPVTITEALTRILTLKKKSLKPKSYRNYRNIHDMFASWLTHQSYNHLRIYQFTSKMAQAYMDHLLLEKDYAGKTYNNQLGILHAFFSLMKAEGRQWIEKNPFAGIDTLPEDVGNNIPYADEERIKITKYLREHDRRLYFAIHFVFHCYIRKTELTTVRVGDIDWTNKTIRINSHAAKNRIQDSVAIPEAFMPILLEMGLDLAPRHYYIFGKGMETCEKRLTRPDDISDRYLEAKKDLGYEAGDGKTFYSWKHTGVIAYWNVINDPYSVMRQLRHGDLQTTMIYLKSLGLNPNAQYLAARVIL